MSATLLTPSPKTIAVPGVRPSQKVWTVPQFHALAELGHFEGTRAILIDGVILEEGPMNPPHAIAGTKTEDIVREQFGRKWHVRVQKPLVLGQTMDPEPDVAVVIGRPGDYTAHPTTAELVIEISDTSLRYDTNEKMHLYAAAGIRDYWVLDVNARQLLVFRDPIADAAAPRGFRYATMLSLNANDQIVPLAAPTATIAVAELLP